MALRYTWLKDNALTYDKENKEVTIYGETHGEEYFREVIVNTALNAAGTSHGVIVSILEPLHVAGMSTRGFGSCSEIFSMYLQDNRAAIAKREAEAKAHQERMEAILASPEEIEKAVAERKARVARNIAAFRKADALF
ncbi:DUF6971 family protein [Lonsdalea quercina]|uniref:DUF6971 family protein n=1 Tax=Lonsdalea quercina TaxID=71657 RepID=UPI003976BE8B